jgi:hypothetical protein
MLFALFVLLSCSDKNEIEGYNDSSIYKDNIVLEDGDSLIKFELMNQFDSYHSAMLDENIDEALSYCMPEMFEYLLKESPGYSMEDIKEIYLGNPIKEMVEKCKKDGVKYEFIIDSIGKKIMWEDNIIFEVKNKVRMSKGVKAIETGGYTIAVSKNNGDSWQFISKEDKVMAEEILLLRYPSKRVRDILK